MNRVVYPGSVMNASTVLETGILRERGASDHDRRIGARPVSIFELACGLAAADPS